MWQKDYHRVGSLLLRLDYAGEKVVARSTKEWVGDVAARAGLKVWGRHVMGTKITPVKRDPIKEATPAMLNVGLIRKKKRPAEELNGGAVETGLESKEPGVNTLSAGLVRKKAKIAGHIESVSIEDTRSNERAELG